MMLISDKTKVMITAVHTTGVMPVLSHQGSDYWQRSIALAYQLGIRVIEYAHTRDHRSLRLFYHLIEICKPYADLHVGAATVLNTNAAREYLQAGAAFISSPFLHAEMGEVCREADALWIPGCASRDEIISAGGMGAKAVSILSSNPAELNSVLRFARQNDIQFLPSYGIQDTHQSLSQWINAGALCIRTLLPIFPKEATAGKNWLNVEQRLFSSIASVKRIRGSHIHNQKQSLVSHGSETN
jgi:2-dehydro-3-deoxyphosphogluconate aldolase / (4S)-4-hydroxy-2-oxoglutarate aldolase